MEDPFSHSCSSLKVPCRWAELCLIAQSCLTLCDTMDCSPPGSSVHGILQTRTLEWVAMPSPRGSSQPRDWSQVSHISDRFFTIWATREVDGHSQINELLSPLVLWLINKEMLKLMGQKHMDSPWLETVSYNLRSPVKQGSQFTMSAWVFRRGLFSIISVVILHVWCGWSVTVSFPHRTAGFRGWELVCSGSPSQPPRLVYCLMHKRYITSMCWPSHWSKQVREGRKEGKEGYGMKTDQGTLVDFLP